MTILLGCSMFAAVALAQQTQPQWLDGAKKYSAPLRTSVVVEHLESDNGRSVGTWAWA